MSHDPLPNHLGRIFLAYALMESNACLQMAFLRALKDIQRTPQGYKGPLGSIPKTGLKP